MFSFAGSMKLQIPNHKHQITNKHKISNNKFQIVLNLEF